MVFIGCKSTKYEEGRDTVVSFGDGTFQICRGEKPSMVLIDNDTGFSIESDVYKYKVIELEVYVIGEHGYTIINLKNKETNTYKLIKDVPKEKADIFKSIQGDRYLVPN